MFPRGERKGGVGAVTSPEDGPLGPLATSEGAQMRHFTPHRDKRGASAERCGWWATGGDASRPPPLTDSRASLNSNRDSG
ncbi:hypothetical protein FJT64_024088 [Amphibalanus amphitrite]|uniref:Uncharacterized protein n=1 Tax=Amphibalanus amphitrite TaxID=1232801 RepID=A0A6A4WDA6_AMPAM|nr:hypothetical protein FJT64_024088 [Amphibalanus amphitrite]